MHPKTCKTSFIFRLSNFENKPQNPAKFYEVHQINLKNITEYQLLRIILQDWQANLKNM